MCLFLLPSPPVVPLFVRHRFPPFTSTPPSLALFTILHVLVFHKSPDPPPPSTANQSVAPPRTWIPSCIPWASSDPSLTFTLLAHTDKLPSRTWIFFFFSPPPFLPLKTWILQLPRPVPAPASSSFTPFSWTHESY